ncbi:hypothetical protein ACQKM2_06725 [Streptomyces sp. NPDC004126]|uniref:pPIWI_RE_Y domain-containing protein n=1 Tax=Streptomyces sp. NPDC004126 TaxID=3390695 RepID=UPI003D043F19
MRPDEAEQDALPRQGPVRPEVVLSGLARALVLLEATENVRSFALPYPSEAQWALDRVVMLSLLAEEDPPLGLADLLVWARTRPLEEWPAGVVPGYESGTETLLDPRSGRPTDLCHEWAWHAPGAPEDLHHLVLREARKRCSGLGDSTAFLAFHTLLVRRPVLTAAELYDVTGDLLLEPLWSLLTEIYQPASDLHVRAGAYAVCERCGILLTPLDGDLWWCERAGCPGDVGRVLERDQTGRPFQLQRPLRQFVTGPGVIETALRNMLVTSMPGVNVDPHLDPVGDLPGLSVTFPDGGDRWDVRVRDWAQPHLLAAALPEEAWTGHPDTTFWVVPDRRIEAREDYVRAFRAASPGRTGPALMSTGELMRRIAERVDGMRRGALDAGP